MFSFTTPHKTHLHCRREDDPALAVTSARTTLCFVLTPRRKASVVRGLRFLFGSALMAVVVFNVFPSPESEMSLSPLELINDQFKKRTAKEASRSVTK